MWSASWDNVAIGVVVTLLVGYLAVQAALGINAAQFFEARRLARREARRHASEAHPRPSSSRWHARSSSLGFTSSTHERRGSERRQVNSQ
jgi:hypothetical protein